MRTVLLLAVSAILLVIGCSTSYDKKHFTYIENYSAKIIPAVEAALVDLEQWLDQSNQDEELLSRLGEHSVSITEINNRYWTEDFPDDKKIEKWRIRRSLGNQEWTIDGNDLADALWFIGANSDWLAGTMEAIASDMDVDTTLIADEAEELSRIIQWLKWMLYRAV